MPLLFTLTFSYLVKPFSSLDIPLYFSYLRDKEGRHKWLKEGNVVIMDKKGKRMRGEVKERVGTFLFLQAIIIPASANSGVLTLQHA